MKKETGMSHLYIFEGKFQSSLDSDSTLLRPANWQHWDRQSRSYYLNSVLSIKTEINSVLIFTVHIYL